MSEINYKEEKRRIETIFGRELSDKEFAESLLYKIRYMKNTYEGALDDVLQTLSDSAVDISAYKEDLDMF